MDPLTITTSVLALAATVSASLKRLKTLRDAPKEIFKLAEDLKDLQLTLCAVERALKDETLESRDGEGQLDHPGNVPNQSLDNDASRLLLGTQRVIKELSQVLGNRLLSPFPVSQPLAPNVASQKRSTTKPKFSRVAWLRWRSKVQDLRKELFDARSNLSTLLGAKTLLEVKSVSLRLNGLAVVGDRHLSLTEVCQRDESDRLEADENEQVELEAASCASGIGNHSTGTSVDAQHCLRKGNAGRASALALSPSPQVRPRLLIPNVPLNSHGESVCPPLCSCVCHRPITFTSPALLTSILGRLSVSSTEIYVPLWTPPLCTEKLCRPPHSAKHTIVYKSPTWLSSKILSLMLTSSLAGGLQMHLRTLRKIPTSSDIFRLAITGDVIKMKALFRDGKASIYDVDDRGWSNLHVSIPYILRTTKHRQGLLIVVESLHPWSE